MGTNNSPRAPRRQTFAKAHLRVEDDWVEVSLANVSSTGLMVKFPGGLAVGSDVEIRRRGSVIKGTVVWATSTRFGVRSAEQIDQSALLDAGLETAVSPKAAPVRKGLWHWRERG